MNRLSTQERASVVRALVEGNSVRATCRLTGAAKGTVLRLLEQIGTACAEYQDAVLRDLPCKRVQVDEIWTFVGCKERRATDAKRAAGQGDAWTFVAVCQDTKLVPTWLCGKRGGASAEAFMLDLASRVAGRIQVTTDGHGIYREAMEVAFRGDVDYGIVVKQYGKADEPETRYSPPRCIGAERRRVVGDPRRADISTSHIERQNLTIRMSSRRFTRLTNAFSKKLRNLEHALALHFAYYNFCRKHQALGTTPAVAAGLCRYPLTIDDLIALLDDRSSQAA